MKTNIIILCAVVASSCDHRPDSKMEISQEAMMAPPPPMKMSEAADYAVTASYSPAEKKETPVHFTERMLIKNGSISFETADIEATRKDIEKLYREFDGYIASENHFNADDRLQQQQEVRIPSKNFDAFVEKVEKLGSKVEHKTIHTQDVTEEFIDLEARLKTKKELEARYRELLRFAKNVKDMLSIEEQIETVRSEIESMEGRLHYLKNQVAFSTISVSYYELTGVDFGFASKFVHALRNGWDNLLGFLISIVNVWPFMLFGSAAIYLLVKYRRRSHQTSVDEQ
jgi:hypothetical protein